MFSSSSLTPSVAREERSPRRPSFCAPTVSLPSSGPPGGRPGRFRRRWPSRALPDAVFRALFPENRSSSGTRSRVSVLPADRREPSAWAAHLLARTLRAKTGRSGRSPTSELFSSEIPGPRELAITHWWPGFIGGPRIFLPLAGLVRGCRRTPSRLRDRSPWSMLAATVAVRTVLEGGTELDSLMRPGALHGSRLRPAGRRKASDLRAVALLPKEWLEALPTVCAGAAGVLASFGLVAAAAPGCSKAAAAPPEAHAAPQILSARLPSDRCSIS